MSQTIVDIINASLDGGKDPASDFKMFEFESNNLPTNATSDLLSFQPKTHKPDWLDKNLCISS